MSVRLRPTGIALALFALLLALATAGPASAQSDSSLIPRAVPAPSLNAKPMGFTVTAGEALRLAGRVPEVARQRAEHGALKPSVGVPNYLNDPPRWEVGFARSDGKRVVEVHVQGRGGRVIEVWTGPHVDNLLARGYEPSMGGKLLNAPYVWLPLCLLFIAPFLDPRRPLRILHLDLLMLLGFGVSQLLLNRGEVELSVPLAYPFLAYVLARMLWIGFRPRPGKGPLVPVVPVGVLAVALVLLVGFRVALNVADSSVIDVGYASVVGADRITHDEQLYTDNDIHGDTYGPVNYVAYLPFEALLPWSGQWDDVPAAHAAALAFDLLTLLGLFLLGRRLRPGRDANKLGIALAFAWAAYPYSTYVLQSNTNDGLLAMLIVYSLLALSSPPGRGLLVGLGAAAKFAPLALCRCSPRAAATATCARCWASGRRWSPCSSWPRSPTCPTAARASSGRPRSASSSGASRCSASGACTRRWSRSSSWPRALRWRWRWLFSRYLGAATCARSPRWRRRSWWPCRSPRRTGSTSTSSGSHRLRWPASSPRTHCRAGDRWTNVGARNALLLKAPYPRVDKRLKPGLGDKGKPAVRRGRKAPGLACEPAELPPRT